MKGKPLSHPWFPGVLHQYVPLIIPGADMLASGEGPTAFSLTQLAGILQNTGTSSPAPLETSVPALTVSITQSKDIDDGQRDRHRKLYPAAYEDLINRAERNVRPEDRLPFPEAILLIMTCRRRSHWLPV
jgi:hypothetical protein